MRTWIFLLAALPCLNISCQGPVASWPGEKKYRFVRYNVNIIANDSLLRPFYEKLKLLETHPEQLTQFNILHIGDSHLQADFATAVSRTGLQKRFGNAGRGTIVPHKLSKSNEPLDYWLLSGGNFRYERLLKSKKSISIGATGVSLRFDGQNRIIPIDIRLKTDSVLDYGFNRVRMLGSTHPGYEGQVEIYKTNNELLVRTAFKPSTTYEWKEKVFELYFDIENKFGKYIDFNGFVLSNTDNGLLYHTLGINGARYIDYVRNDSLIPQWKSLSPDLIVLSLGTNEVIRGKFNRDENLKQLDSFFSELRLHFPQTPVLICTPFDGYFGRAHTNSRLLQLDLNLTQMARRYSAAIWDGYRIGGGFGSAYSWKRSGLLTNDGVHFTRAGYQLQGALLQQAIINGYNTFSN